MNIHCANCGPELAAWAAGELEPGLRDAVAAHLADCPACRRELERELVLRSTLAGLPSTACPAVVVDRIQGVITREQSVGHRRRRLAAGGALAAAALAGALLLRPGAGDDARVPVALLESGSAVSAPATATPLPSPVDPAAHAAAVAAAGYTPEQVAAARRDLIRTVALAAAVLDRTGRQTISDVFSERVPAAVAGSLRPLDDPTRGG
ncbi:MAG: zf-HC2 domain-containing protein [bacterium]|nr:zf-HC2 domain-containing protein [bacterium]